MQSSTHAVRKLGGAHNGRTILVDTQSVRETGKQRFTGENPELVQLKMRPASSAPTGTRLKATLVMTAPDGSDVQLPFAQATIFPVTGQVPAFAAEFRLEMN